MTTSVQSCGYFREKSCRFGVVCVMFGIPKRMCFRALWEMFLLFLSVDVLDN